MEGPSDRAGMGGPSAHRVYPRPTCPSEPPCPAPERRGRHPLFPIAFAGSAAALLLLATTFAGAVTICSEGMAGTYPCRNIDLMSFLALDDIGGGSADDIANDIWGWKDSLTGKEYAIMGRKSGTSFVDVSDPANPIYLGNLPPHSTDSDWRDIKVYADHAFIVTEADDSGMQVFDLTRLRSVASPPATFSETAHYSGFSHAHNIAINEDSGFAYVVGANNCGGGLHMIDIQTPANPTSAGCFSADGYTHDAQCVNYVGPDLDHQGKEICFNSNEDALTIVDVTNKAVPEMLSRTGYSGSRFTHQGWLTEDQAYFLLGDEADETDNPDVANTRTYLWDVGDLDGPVLTGSHDSTTSAIDHNLYVKGGYTYQSNYYAGLRILDITDIANGNLSEVAFFDFNPGIDSASTEGGTWSNYPFFDSGIVMVSVIEQGLFILRPNLVDRVNPVLSSAAVNGAALTLTYGEALDESSTPPPGDFTLAGGDSARTVSSVTVGGRTVVLTLLPAAGRGETGITVSYRRGTSPIRDAAGNEAEGLSDQPVANNTGDTTVPAPAPDAPRNLQAEGKDGAVTLSWDTPYSDGGAPITDYEYWIFGTRGWTSIGSTDTSHTVSGLANGTVYAFQVRAVNNRNGKSRASDRAEATPGAGALHFTHFANGTGITSEVVLVNLVSYPIQPALYFYDRGGHLIDPETVVDVTGDLEVREDGSLTVRTRMVPLGKTTISTHGRGELVAGSLKVLPYGPIGGFVRYSIPGLGVAAAGASPLLQDVLFPARRQAGGIRTEAALHNRGKEAMRVRCQLLSEGAVLEEVEIPLEANGKTSWFIEEAFTTTDTSDFAGTVRCTAPGRGRFTALAVEQDAGERIFTTLPVVPVSQFDMDSIGSSDNNAALDFAHFANGTWISDIVLVNPSTRPSRPGLYFHDTQGNPIAAESVVDLTGDLAVAGDGALTVRTAIEPLGVLTISTHGRGELVTGSVRVDSGGPIGGMLRFRHPDVGVGAVEADSTLHDALIPVRRQQEGIDTGVALHNLEPVPGLLRCDLMKEGVLQDSATFPLAANGQTSWLIDTAFPGAETSDFSGSLRCTSVEGYLFSAMALEMDPGTRTFITLPVFPLHHPGGVSAGSESGSGKDASGRGVP